MVMLEDAVKTSKQGKSPSPSSVPSLAPSFSDLFGSPSPNKLKKYSSKQYSSVRSPKPVEEEHGQPSAARKSEGSSEASMPPPRSTARTSKPSTSSLPLTTAASRISPSKFYTSRPKTAASTVTPLNSPSKKSPTASAALKRGRVDISPSTRQQLQFWEHVNLSALPVTQEKCKPGQAATKPQPSTTSSISLKEWSISSHKNATLVPPPLGRPFFGCQNPSGPLLTSTLALVYWEPLFFQPTN